MTLGWYSRLLQTVLIRVQSYSIAHLIKGWEGQFLEKMTRSKNTLPLVLHGPFGCFPSPVGGTEAYVAALCRELQGLGVANVEPLRAWRA